MAFGDFKDLTIKITSNKILQEKHLILLKLQNMMDVKEVFLQWFLFLFYLFIIFFDEKLLLEQLKLKSNLIKNLLKNYTNKLLEHLKNEKHIQLFRQHFGC